MSKLLKVLGTVFYLAGWVSVLYLFRGDMNDRLYILFSVIVIASAILLSYAIISQKAANLCIEAYDIILSISMFVGLFFGLTVSSHLFNLNPNSIGSSLLGVLIAIAVWTTYGLSIWRMGKSN